MPSRYRRHHGLNVDGPPQEVGVAVLPEIVAVIPGRNASGTWYRWIGFSPTPCRQTIPHSTILPQTLQKSLKFMAFLPLSARIIERILTHSERRDLSKLPLDDLTAEMHN